MTSEGGYKSFVVLNFDDAVSDIEQFFARIEIRIAMSIGANGFGVRATRSFDELATKDDFAAMEERLSLHIQACGDKIIKALCQHIDMAVESAIARHIVSLDRRISRLEEKLGLYPIG